MTPELEEGICPACNGSGEGYCDNSICYRCKGTGVQYFTPDGAEQTLDDAPEKDRDD